MVAIYTFITIIIIMTIYEILAKDDEDNLLDIEISNKEYEKRFIFAVSRIDKGNINWTIKALRQIKGSNKYYCSNPRAIAILNKLEQASKNKNPKIVDFIKSCYLYN